MGESSLNFGPFSPHVSSLIKERYLSNRVAPRYTEEVWRKINSELLRIVSTISAGDVENPYVNYVLFSISERFCGAIQGEILLEKDSWGMFLFEEVKIVDLISKLKNDLSEFPTVAEKIFYVQAASEIVGSVNSSLDVTRGYLSFNHNIVELLEVFRKYVSLKRITIGDAYALKIQFHHLLLFQIVDILLSGSQVRVRGGNYHSVLSLLAHNDGIDDFGEEFLKAIYGKP